MDSLFGLSDPLIKTMFEALTLGPVHVAYKRALLVKKLSRRAIELDKEEKRLHADMPQEVARVLKGKHLLLLQEVAESLDWPDSAVFTELRPALIWWAEACSWGSGESPLMRTPRSSGTRHVRRPLRVFWRGH